MFEIEFLDDTGAQQTAWTTSWGVSTRMVGGLIMAHGDDDGLRVPPRLAPVQVVVLAVRDEGDVVARCRALADELRAAGVRAQLDDRADVSIGRRATDWELKGVPVRLELGPRDLADGVVTLVRRIAGGEERKVAVPLDGVVDAVRDELDAAAGRAARRGDRRCATSRTADVATLDDARDAAATGWARMPVGHGRRRGRGRARPGRRHACGASRGPTARCPTSDDEPDLVAVVARSY